MANWQHTIELKPIRDRYNAGDFDMETFGKKVAEQIKQEVFEYKQDETLLSIIEGFENHCEDVENFDVQLKALYDWGDQVLSTDCWPHEKMAWIGFAF